MSNIGFNFTGKVVLITGSSSGIGAGTAILFSKAGANVVITGRNATKLSKVAEKCQKISPNNSKPLQVLGDVSKKEDLKRLVETAIQEFGKLDVLVNNAGFAEFTHITEKDYMDSFKRVMETNLNSVVYLTHLCVEYLAKTKGNIINISSIGGLITYDKSSAYCMSKASMDMFTKCMAAELGSKRIRVNSVKTDIMERIGIGKTQSNMIYDTLGKKYPVGRAGEPQDIANTILYLAASESSFITGTLLVADGGYLAANPDLGQSTKSSN